MSKATHGPSTSHSKAKDRAPLSIAEQLWSEPTIEKPSAVFKRYLRERAHFNRHIAAAAAITDVAGSNTAVDRLCSVLSDAQSAVIDRQPTNASDAVEIAIAVRDSFFDPGQTRAHSVINSEDTVRLIVAVLASVRLQTNH